HLNVPFREPLVLDFEQQYNSAGEIMHLQDESSLSPSMQSFLEEVIKTEKGLLIIGEMPDKLPADFWTFIRKLNWPVLADSLSNLRGNLDESCADLIIDSYDAILKSGKFKAQMVPDAVIRIGPQPVSKPLTLYLASAKPEIYAIFDESPM